MDTVWTSDSSPYILTGHLLVPESLRLVITPGVEVDLNGWFIKIEGLLEAVGTSESPISFFGFRETEDGNKVEFAPTSAPWSERDNSGSIIQHARFRGSADIGLVVVNGSSPKLSFLDVTNQDHSGVELGGPALLEDSRICGNRLFGIIVSASSPTIRRNIICQNNEMGIAVTGEASEPLFVENVIQQNGPGGRNEVQGGIRIDVGAPIFLLNRIQQNNAVGILIIGDGVGEIRIEQNSIIENDPFAIRMWQRGIDVNVSNNWWGTTDTIAIEALLYDQTEDYRLGQIIYETFLTEPHPNTP